MRLTKYAKALDATHNMVERLYRSHDEKGGVEPEDFVRELTRHSNELRKITSDLFYHKGFKIIIMWSPDQ